MASSLKTPKQSCLATEMKGSIECIMDLHTACVLVLPLTHQSIEHMAKQLGCARNLQQDPRFTDPEKT